MRLSLQAQYAVCGMFDLAYNGQGAPIQVRVIGERQRIPARYLEQIFQRLRRARLVRGKRGPGGGYVLARPAGEITLREIVEAVEGPVSRTLGGPPSREGREPYRPSFVWEELGARLESALEELDLESICRRAAAHAVRRADADSRMWHI
jgi:Rrf2 family protein